MKFEGWILFHEWIRWMEGTDSWGTCGQEVGPLLTEIKSQDAIKEQPN